MSQCQFCKDNVPAFARPGKAHLIMHMDDTDHCHVHGTLENKNAVREMLMAAEEHSGIILNAQKMERKEIVFHNRQRIGDTLMFTCGVRDFKKAFPDVRVNVMSIAQHIWDNNPYLDRTVIPSNENTVKIGPGELTNASNRLDWHFANAYRYSMEKALKINIPQGESRPDIWLTEEEYNAPRVFKEPYWIICITGEKGWGCKMYPPERWQTFIEQNPDKVFVQIGAREDNPPRLKGPNVIDYVGQTQDKNTGIRDLFKLFLNAEGSVSLVSFAMHLSGALYKPAVVIAGAREPVHFTRYPGHAYLSNDGMLPCADTKACWHCDISACTNLIDIGPEGKRPKCVDMIDPADITRSINGYYRGGRLVKGIPSAKPSRKVFKNVVADKTKSAAGLTNANANPDVHHMSFNGGALTEADWQGIQSIIAKTGVKTCLEFGAGYSTILLNDAGIKTLTYETDPRWLLRVKKDRPNAQIRMWDGKTIITEGGDLQRFDLAFVDGPPGGHAREDAVRIASEHADLIIVHDGYDVFEEMWQAKYLSGKFHGPYKCGTRGYFWDKTGKIGPEVGKLVNLKCGANPQSKQAIVEGGGKDDSQKEGRISCDKPERQEHGGAVQEQSTSCETSEAGRILQAPRLGRKFIKIVSTARGWGGCARSVTTLMRMLLSLGHKVEFIPFRNAVTSSEMQKLLNSELKEVLVTNDFNSLSESCDVLLVYADDFIWEFKRPDIIEAFSNIGADRKIMMLNYRRGPVGEVEWTKGWDKYMFLNSTQERELKNILPGIQTKVLPPCTDLSPFFPVKPDYNHSLRIVRHSSQGDTKFDRNVDLEMVQDILDLRPDVSISMLPGPSWIETNGRFRKVARTAKPEVIAEFLATGNLFWYSLPHGYMDMGPRVILEAMACGLPILADNWGGAVDRVTCGCGWLYDEKIQHVQKIKHVSPQELKEAGEKARERAFREFRAERWIEELIG